MADAAKSPEAAPRFLTIAAAATRYGFKSPLALKRFALRNGLPIKCVGKLRFIAPADVEALIAGERPLPANDVSPPEGVDAARVDAAAAKLMGGGR